MKVFALIFTIGISSGSETLLGLFSTKEKAEEKAEIHAKKYGHTKYHYRKEEIEIDKDINIMIAQW